MEPRKNPTWAGSLSKIASWMARGLMIIAFAMLGKSGVAQSEAANRQGDNPTDGHEPDWEECGFIAGDEQATYVQVGTAEGDGHYPPPCTQ